MIQRIQTFYLGAGVIALIAVLFLQLSNGAVAASQAWFVPACVILGGLAVVAAAVAVFLYKDRSKQRRVIVLAQTITVLFLLVLYGGLYFADALYIRTTQGIDVGMVVFLLLPLVAYLFFYLARRGVEKDIKLVRSMDRLR